TSFRQQLPSLYASAWHVCDKPGCSIAQQCPLHVLRHLDDASTDGFFGSGPVYQLHVMRAWMCDRDRIGLNDSSASDCRHGAKVIGGVFRVGCADRFRNWDHVGKACVHYGSMPLVVLHIGKLLKKIGNRKPLKIRRVGLASAIYKVTLPTSAVRAVFT